MKCLSDRPQCAEVLRGSFVPPRTKDEFAKGEVIEAPISSIPLDTFVGAGGAPSGSVASDLDYRREKFEKALERIASLEASVREEGIRGLTSFENQYFVTCPHRFEQAVTALQGVVLGGGTASEKKIALEQLCLLSVRYPEIRKHFLLAKEAIANDPSGKWGRLDRDWARQARLEPIAFDNDFAVAMVDLLQKEPDVFGPVSRFFKLNQRKDEFERVLIFFAFQDVSESLLLKSIDYIEKTYPKDSAYYLWISTPQQFFSYAAKSQFEQVRRRALANQSFEQLGLVEEQRIWAEENIDWESLQGLQFKWVHKNGHIENVTSLDSVVSNPQLLQMTVGAYNAIMGTNGMQNSAYIVGRANALNPRRPMTLVMFERKPLNPRNLAFYLPSVRSIFLFSPGQGRGDARTLSGATGHEFGHDLHLSAVGSLPYQLGPRHRPGGGPTNRSNALTEGFAGSCQKADNFYRQPFYRDFPDPEVSEESIGTALAAYYLDLDEESLKMAGIEKPPMKTDRFDKVVDTLSRGRVHQRFQHFVDDFLFYHPEEFDDFREALALVSMESMIQADDAVEHYLNRYTKMRGTGWGLQERQIRRQTWRRLKKEGDWVQKLSDPDLSKFVKWKIMHRIEEMMAQAVIQALESPHFL